MKKTITIAALFLYAISFAQQTPEKDSVKVEHIQEVMMTKKVFTKKSDRFVYDVSQTPAVKGNTTFDILKQMPMVSSTDDKTLMIAGKNNAVIFIDGRKTNMDAESLAQFLQNTPAENIQKIEVITTPGSEYQVESSDGIINIILKKKSSNGLNGNMRMSNSQNKYNSTSAGVSLNYRKDKLGISTSINTSDNIQPQTYIIRNGNGENFTESVGDIDDPNKNIGGYVNIDYQVSDQSNLALTWNSWANRSYGSSIDLFNQVRTADGVSYSWSKNIDNSRTYNNAINLNYELKLDSLGSKLNANAAYLIYRRFQFTDNRTLLSDAYRNELGLSKQIIQKLPQQIENYTGMLDYVKKFKSDFSIAAGGYFNKTKTDNDIDSETLNFTSNTSIEEPNHFIYDENIYAAYLTLEKQFSPRFSGKIGARYEITNSLGTSDNAQDSDLKRIERNYKNLLPYLSFNFAVNDQNNLSYSFSSRMRRPSFWELNPVKNILTDDNYVQNNPFVKASSVYSQELTYMYKNSYFLVLSHSYTKDVINQIPLQGFPVSSNGEVAPNYQMRYIRTNFGNKQEMSAMLGMQKSFFKQILNSNFNIGLQHNRNNGSLSVDPTTGDVFPTYTNKINSTSLLITSSNTVRLDKQKSWFAGVNFFYVDQQQIELGLLKDLMSLDLSLKKVWNNWTFNASVNDVLKTNLLEIEDIQPNGNYNYLQNNQYRQKFTFSVVYNFGNQKIKKVREIKDASSDASSRTR